MRYARTTSGALRSGPSWIEGARVARKSPSFGDTRGVNVGDLQWSLRLCIGVFNGGHGNKRCLVERARR